MQGWLEALNNAFFIGILDILLVSYLIYRILLMVRGTRALPMLVGLGIIVVVFILARESGLVTLGWILGNFLGSAILVVVVLFQDDLRRALVKVGLGPGLGGAHQVYLERSIKEIAKAASELSDRRLGAIVVVQRDIGLEEYTEQAVKVDALVSSELLVSIFLPSSPIHDGAVVINKDRIVAAGSLLPLTFNRALSGNLGTRHRAALGLSERVDALVIVVSEESGIISLIHEGKLIRDLNESTLFNHLHNLTVVGEGSKDKKSSWKFWKKSEGKTANKK